MEYRKVHIEYMKETNVAYFRRMGPYGSENGKLMHSFKQWVKAEGLFEGSTILGIALDNPQNVPDANCRYDVCLIINKEHLKNNRIKQRPLPSIKYAIFKIPHTEIAINEFYKKLNQIICEKQLKVLNKPIIERYKQKLVSLGFCEILIPIE
ncbi:DNA gyrase inhibitor [Lacticaseibacillus rhamnosus]|jgi:DNA gyrase inhibitor GyrI|uniref:AraC family transcriptional regulator n=1 Tax=Lacticaseibacillus rhamnosus TaxID=47715 RepID=UPI0001B5EA0E|nr:GyrI-like domain-containing protein [Lacticaseibacillus rhamnosus]AON63728.1 DNA gyrase inhibitor [Lacticaseibacillus rhamnosus]AQY35290.1 DNA gyrase inhibitor [Lacticaseibacillus rhamnosus]ART96472.1 DNA gyrase inhibitor [Lacticaseibacillus rhamnosus]AXI95035.1 DNA gyrase inhibitor [Lacticaseibacillus rhamnosus GG]AZZ23705.1 DNA gyrase inhibitor [Lacticaseibacillus rhamnosus]